MKELIKSMKMFQVYQIQTFMIIRITQYIPKKIHIKIV